MIQPALTIKTDTKMILTCSTDGNTLNTLKHKACMEYSEIKERESKNVQQRAEQYATMKF